MTTETVKSTEEQLAELHDLVKALHDQREDDHTYQKHIRREFDNRLAQEQQANAALLGWFLPFRALVCKVAWAVGELSGRTGVSGGNLDYPGLAPHSHVVFTDEQYAALASLAALDTSGYAPQALPEGFLVEGTGTGEPPIPPRYEADRFEVRGDFNRIHTDGKLPSTKGAVPS